MRENAMPEFDMPEFDMNDEDRYGEYLEHGDHGGGAALEAATRDELDVLRRMLGSSEVWAEPPADLADAVLAGIRDARGEVAPAPAPARTAPPKPGRARLLVAAAAALLLVVAAAGVVVATRDGSEGGEEFALAATERIPGASGDANVEETGSGLSIALSIDGLPPAEPGTFYQAWMKGPGGSVPIGTFHAREGDGPIELWSGVDAADYPTMTVTIQREGAGPESSGEVVLMGDLPPPS
jgi:hypothetical protein